MKTKKRKSIQSKHTLHFNAEEILFMVGQMFEVPKGATIVVVDPSMLTYFTDNCELQIHWTIETDEAHA